MGHDVRIPAGDPLRTGPLASHGRWRVARAALRLAAASFFFASCLLLTWCVLANADTKRVLTTLLDRSFCRTLLNTEVTCDVSGVSCPSCSQMTRTPFEQVAWFIQNIGWILDYQEFHAHQENALANAFRERGEIAIAAEHYRKAIQASPTYGRPYVNLATMYMALGEFARALSSADEAVARQPDNSTPWTVRGNAKLLIGDIGGAIADQNVAIAHQPSFDVPLNNRGCAHAAAGQFNQAIDDFEHAIEIGKLGRENSALAVAYFNRAAVLDSVAEHARSAQSLAEAKRLSPEIGLQSTFIIMLCGIGAMGHPHIDIASVAR